MLFVDKEQVKVTKFPNGELLVDTTLLRKLKDGRTTYLPILLYKYDGSDSIQELMLACDYLGEADYHLYISYLPYERMDRVQEDNCYSLQTFMRQLQAVFKGNGIIVNEVHSHFTEEPIKRKISNRNTSAGIALQVIEQGGVDVICYPDKGARKRFDSLGEDAGKPQIYCEKVRDFSTGKIMGLDLITDGYDVTGKHVLIVDDLCSAGGTFYYTAQKLREAGASKVDLVVTHMENNVLNGKILQTTDEKTVIDHIYCMNTMGNMDELGLLHVAKNLTVYDVLGAVFLPMNSYEEIILDKEDVKNYVGHAI